MAMTEGAAFDVFAGQPDADAIGEDRRERQILGSRPVNRPLVRIVQRIDPLLAHPLELAVHGEVGGQRQERRVELPQPIERHRRLRLGGGAWRRRLGLRLDVVLLRPQPVERGLQRRHMFLEERVGLLRADGAAIRERARPDLAHRRMLGDLLVHQRLREGRLVPLVVPVTPVADQIDQEVPLEPLAIGKRQPRRFHARFGIVRVDMHDRDLEAARQAARVEVLYASSPPVVNPSWLLAMM